MAHSSLCGRRGAALAALLCAALAGPALAAHTAPLQPAPVPSRGGALKACPSPQGLLGFDAAARAQARREALAYFSAGRARDLAVSDRSWWSSVGAPEPGRQRFEVVGAGPATQSGYAIIVRYSCGARLLERSLVVVLAPRQPPGVPHCEACRENFFLVDRRGRPLIYFIY